MRIDRSHLPWLLATLAATALAGLLYTANFHPQQMPFHLPLPAFLGEVPPIRQSRGAAPLGLIFGAVAFAIFLFASALGIRKKQRLWPIGNVRLWLKAHIWLTILTIPLVLLHCGFRVGGLHAQWLMVLYVVVMVSGFVGLALQQFLPRVMKDRLPREVVFEQIPRLRRELFAKATEMRRGLRASERIVPAGAPSEGPPALDDEAASARALAQFLDDACLPYLAAERGDRLWLGEVDSAAGAFRSLRVSVAADWRPKVDVLERWCQERRWMDLQTRYQHWLHGWLLVHVPASFALLVLTGWHAWAGLRYFILPA